MNRDKGRGREERRRKPENKHTYIRTGLFTRGGGRKKEKKKKMGEKKKKEEEEVMTVGFFLVTHTHAHLCSCLQAMMSTHLIR